jgi:hypothetical protein
MLVSLLDAWINLYAMLVMLSQEQLGGLRRLLFLVSLPSFLKTTRFLQFPYQLPIDYFDPTWFNDDTKLSVAI